MLSILDSSSMSHSIHPQPPLGVQYCGDDRDVIIGFDGGRIVYVNVGTYVGGMLLLFLLFVLLFGDYYRSLVK